MKDMWVLDMMRKKEERQWTRIDPYIIGAYPPSMSYHTMVYIESARLMVVFGGLHWSGTDLEESDRLRNIDRRRFKEAQGLPENDAGSSESDFLARMRRLCANSGFCCRLTQQSVPPAVLDGSAIRTVSGSLNLTAIS